MNDRDRELSTSFMSALDRRKISDDWDGSEVRLASGQSVHMKATPDGPLIVAYRIAPKLNKMATLTLTAPGRPPKIVMIQPGASLPGVVIRDWGGKDLYVTNISHASNVEIWVNAFGDMPGRELEDLPAEEMREFHSGKCARIQTATGFQQVLFEARAPELTLFAMIVGKTPEEAAKAHVFAAYAETNSGPGTDTEPPPGYCATTKASNFSFESYVTDENLLPSEILLKNISPEMEEAAHPIVHWRLLE